MHEHEHSAIIVDWAKSSEWLQVKHIRDFKIANFLWSRCKCEWTLCIITPQLNNYLAGKHEKKKKGEHKTTENSAPHIRKFHRKRLVGFCGLGFAFSFFLDFNHIADDAHLRICCKNRCLFAFFIFVFLILLVRYSGKMLLLYRFSYFCVGISVAPVERSFFILSKAYSSIFPTKQNTTRPK